MQLRILVGTVSGTAQRVADAIALACDDLASITVLPMDGLDMAVFDASAPLTLLCCSTYGSGDVPDNALGLYDALASDPRYLGHLRYGVIALGDSSHGESFCGGGLRFDERLADLGAQRVGDVLRIDALEEPEPEQVAVTWCRDWLARACN